MCCFFSFLRAPQSEVTYVTDKSSNSHQCLGLLAATALVMYHRRKNWHNCFAYCLFCDISFQKIAGNEDVSKPKVAATLESWAGAKTEARGDGGAARQVGGDDGQQWSDSILIPGSTVTLSRTFARRQQRTVGRKVWTRQLITRGPVRQSATTPLWPSPMTRRTPGPLSAPPMTRTTSRTLLQTPSTWSSRWAALRCTGGRYPAWAQGAWTQRTVSWRARRGQTTAATRRTPTSWP